MISFLRSLLHTAALSLSAAFFLLSAKPIRAEVVPFLITSETPAFTLDLRIGSAFGTEAALFLLAAESAPFALDTRLPGSADSADFRVAAESGLFTLDTRRTGSPGADPADFQIAADSGVFTLDTRYGMAPAEEEFRVVAESGTFTLDTRLPAGTGRQTGDFVVTTESEVFTLDTRLPGADPRYAEFIVVAESAAFTLDTSWLHAPPALGAWRNEPMAVSGVSVEDPDVRQGLVSLTISATHGTVTVRGDVSGGLGAAAVSGNGTRVVRADALLAQIKATLGASGGLIYRPDTGFTGVDALRLYLAGGASPGGGAPLTADATTAITVRVRPQVVGRYVFYDNSAWDKTSDDAAVPSCQTALLPGVKAAFANYTSYARGLNGIMVDIATLPGTPTVADFEFRVGNSDDVCAWAAGPVPSAVTVRLGAGTGGSDRVSLFWGENATKKKWLQVRVRGTAATGLAADDVFYFGNAPGETGNNPGDAIVNATDEILVRQNPQSPFNPATICNSYDFNRDKLVNASDQIIARLNTTSPFTALRLITPSTAACAAALAGAAVERSATLERRSESGVRAAPAIHQTFDQGITSAIAPTDAGSVQLGFQRLPDGRIRLHVERGVVLGLRLEMSTNTASWVASPMETECTSEGHPAWIIDQARCGDHRFFRLSADAPLTR